MSKYAFTCFKTGHEAIEELPGAMNLIDGFPHITRICRKCKVLFFQQISEEAVHASGLIDLQGKEIMVNESDEVPTPSLLQS